MKGKKGILVLLSISFYYGALFSDILPYKIIDQQVMGSFVASKVIWKVLVSTEELPTEEDIRGTATKIWQDGNTLWDNFTIFVYLPEINPEGAAYYFLEFAHGGLQKVQIQEFALQNTKWADIQKTVKAEKKKKKSDRPILEYTLAVKTKKSEGRKIDVLVRTNFPEGTNLEIQVARPFFQRQKEEEFFGIMKKEICAVSEGKIEKSYEIDDSKWYYKVINREGVKKEDKEYFTKFKSISPRIKIAVTYSPEIKQPESVVKVLGKNADYVAGKGVGKIGYGMPYVVEKFTEVHFER